jgi:RES domain
LTELSRIPVSDTAWKPSYRLIASRYPTVSLYDDIADPADLDVVFAIEALTNPRIRNEIGQLQLVLPEERVSGAGSTPIMAAFTHLNPEGSRFSDGGYGVYYAAQDLDTAVAEVSHHRALFLSRTAEAAIDIDLRLITAPLDAPLHDLRKLRGEAAAAVYDPANYSAGQALGRRLRETGSWGVLYHSVRHRGGLCAGLFRPRALRAAKEAAHIALHWDGARITHWYEKRAPKSLLSAP